MNKALIRERFARNLKSYNQNAKIQNKMAQRLISFSDKNDYEKIFEIGCGTGLLTEKAVKALNFKIYDAVDIIEACREYTEPLDDRIEFRCLDIESVKVFEDKYDLIISNAVFQWFENVEDIINKLMQTLNPGGVLLFSTFGKENFRQIKNVTGKTLNYKSKEDFDVILKKFPHKIEEEICELSFEKPVEVLKHLKLTGVNSLESQAWTKSDMFKFEKEYNSTCSGRPILTYNPIYIKILNCPK